jgi:hypothetical protein
MRELQILILDLAGNQLGELDLTDSDDFALKLTKSIASINDIGRRNTSFSLDFDAPQTKNNNKLLNGLRFATTSKEILGQKPCAIVVDGNQVDRGFVYPFQSEFDGMYKLVFKGLNNDWVEQLRDVELNELNWRDYQAPFARSEDATELFTGARIGALNTQNSTTADLTYPYINRNNDGAAIHFRPQLHLRSIVLAMFEKIGYTVSSVFFDSDWIKAGANGVAYPVGDDYGNPYTHMGLSVDPGFQMTRDQQDLNGQLVEQKTTNIVVPIPQNWNPTTFMGNMDLTPNVSTVRKFYRFPGHINQTIQDTFGRFDSVNSEFTVGLSGTYSLEFFFNFQFAYYDGNLSLWKHYATVLTASDANYVANQMPNWNTVRPPNFKWYIVKNNTSDTAIDGTIIYTFTNSTGQRVIHDLQKEHPFNSGDKISVFLELLDDAKGFHTSAAPKNKPSLDRWRVRIENSSVLRIVPKADVQLGDTFRINSHIPEGIKCITLLQDFKTMFNLYFDVDVNRKIVFIEPRDEFYTGVSEDITDIVDLSTSPVLNYLSSYKNEMVFEYVTDSKDKYLEQWNKINDKTYAQYKYLLNNPERFEKGQSKLSTSLISATIQGPLNGATNIFTSVVKEEYLDADNLAKPVNKNYSPRVFQLILGQQYDTAGVPRRTASPLVVLAAAMEDYGNTPTFEDRRLTFNATNGLVENYYAKTLANIEDTAILTVKLNMTLTKFNEWDLKRTYYISEPAEIAGYYITDSIKNFNVTKETLTTVTLVKFKDFTPVAVPGGVGNVNVITQTGTQPTPILCTVNGAIVDCLDNNLQQMFKL